MTSLAIYSKDQVDALIAGAGGGGFERVARADYGTLTNKDLLIFIYIEQTPYVLYVDKNDYNASFYINHMKIIPDMKSMVAQIPLGAPANFLSAWSASSTYSLGGTPFKLHDDSGVIKWVIDTDSVPLTYSMSVDPTYLSNNGIIVLAR